MSDMSNHPALTIRQIDLRDPDESARLSAYVRAHPDSTPFHLPAWLLAIEKGCGQKARMLIAEDGDGQVAGVMPLSEVRSILFGKALVSSGFAVGGGVLAETENAAQQLLNAALDHARREGFPTVEMRGGNVSGEGWHVDAETYRENNAPKSARHWDLTLRLRPETPSETAMRIMRFMQPVSAILARQSFPEPSLMRFWTGSAKRLIS
jgi:hypothetical protein